MKHITSLCLCASVLNLSAAVPLRWTVETSRATPAQFEAYQGETLALEAALQSYGKPLEAPSNYSFYWQTNGMGSTYWEAPVPSRPSATGAGTNVLFATWSPTNDVGAKVYNCFIGQPGTIYHAAFQLRLRPSPGATPNVLPLPVPVIDFAKVRVLNPPWEGGGGGVNTNAVRDIAREEITPATNRLNQTLTDSTNRLYKTLIDAKDGAARPLPKYLHIYNADDSYPEAAQAYYDQRQGGGAVPAPQCSSVRSGGFLYRNFDYPFDERAEFVVRMSAGIQTPTTNNQQPTHRFASVGVAQIGTNLTEQMVTSGKPEYSRLYKWLPGATVDGINENGVACNINVVDGDPQTSGWHNDTGDLHPLAAIRWILDNATNAQHAATYLAANIAFPSGWTQNFHYMIADETATYIVENGTTHQVENGVPAMTNFRLYGDPKDTTGEGQERYIALTNGANITSQWWTLTYTANGYRASDLPGITGEALTQLFNYFESNPRESHRGESFGDKVWWQTVHTSIYDISNRVLRVAVQEVDDWYTFQVPSSGAKIDAYTKSETDAKLAGKLDAINSSRWRFNNGKVEFDENGGGETPAWFTIAEFMDDENGTLRVGTDVYLSDTGDKLSEKADRAGSGDDGELAALDEDGNPIRSGKTADDFAAKNGDESEDFSANMLTLRGGAEIDGTVTVYPIRADVSPEIRVTQNEEEGSTDADVIIFGASSGTVYHSLRAKADRSMISATNPAFSNAVLSVATGISTNDWAVIASVADWASVIPGGVPTGAGTLGAVLAALAATVLALKKKTSLLKSDGTAEDDFATNLMAKQVAKEAIDNRTKASASSITGDALTLPDGGVVSAESSAPTITFGTARQDGLRFCELYITNPDTAADGAIVSISGKVYSDISLTELPKLDKGATYYFTFAEFKVENGVSHWKVSKQKLDAMGGDIPAPTAA